MSDFPHDFLWGSATSAHQVEGNNVSSDWWAWEHAAETTAVEPSGDAIDHYHRFDDDFRLLAALGQNAHRFSIEWARVEPEPGEVSVAALDHYDRVLDSLLQHGLTPMATIYHFSLPAWFSRRGGWLAADVVELFARYVAVVGDRLGDRLPYIATINEPQMFAWAAHGVAMFPPGHADVGEFREVNRVLMSAHRTAVDVLRSSSNAKLGTCLALPLIEPARIDDTGDIEAANDLRETMVDSHLRDLGAGGDVGDFVGLQYYTRMRADTRRRSGFLRPDTTPSLMGWEIYPSGLTRMLERVAEVGLPVFITENGIATDDDRERVKFLREHVLAMHEAMQAGVDVRGYFHWSSFDNFEWSSGYRPTFGLIGIDRKDNFRRIVRPSAEAYGRLARTGILAALET